MATTATRKKRPDPKDINRPFDPRILRRARAIASRYRITLWREDGEWYGQGVEEPGAMGDGRTIQQAAKSTRDAMVVAVAYLLESAKPIVEPIVDRERRGRKAG